VTEDASPGAASDADAPCCSDDREPEPTGSSDEACCDRGAGVTERDSTTGSKSDAATGSGLDAAAQRRAVRERYAGIATADDGATDGTDGTGSSNGAADASSDGCCSGDGATDGCGESAADESARQVGYTAEEVASVADGANLGLGCGNPGAIADLEPGETVLDLGSGAGFDCFLAAREVGESGRVLGVDMTPAMVEKARENATENDAGTVEFRLGEIEHLPVADGTVDVVISNCVINLSPDKPQVFREAYRALRPGGRLAVSDVVRTAEIPTELRADPDSVSACVAGAATVDELESMLAGVGFVDVSIEPKADSEQFIREWDDDHDPSEFVRSASIEARKPDTGAGDGA
jgi:SAM-dependent methyltransferase